jgi:hypothetical protein
VEPDVVERRKYARVPGEQARWRAVRLRTGDPLALVDLAPGGALVESNRRLLPGAMVVLQVTLEEGSFTVRALVTRCAVHALRSDAVQYRGALEFEEEVGFVGHAPRIDLCA